VRSGVDCWPQTYSRALCTLETACGDTDFCTIFPPKNACILPWLHHCF